MPLSLNEIRNRAFVSMDFPDATLADLVKVYASLDKAVDAAYIAEEKAAARKPPKLATEAARVAFLFERYQALTSLLPMEKPKKLGRRRKNTA